MNEIFNFKRFGKCLGSDLVRGSSKYGITLLILGLLEVLVFLFLHVLMLIFNRNGHSLGMFGTVVNVNSIPVDFTFYVATMILMFGMPAALYGHVTDKHAGADFLMVPASSLEKFLSMFLVCQIIFPLIFLGLFFGSDALLGVIDGKYQSIWNGLIMHDLDVSKWLLLYSLCASIGTFLLGAIWFRRHKIVYTILILLGLGMVVGVAVGVLFLNTDLMDNFLDNDLNSFKFNWFGYLTEVIILILCYLRIRKLQH